MGRRAMPGPEDLLLVVGWALRHRRKQLKRTLTQVAGCVGVTVSYLSAIERGHHNPQLALLERWCRVLDVGMTYLFSEAAREAYRHHLRVEDMLDAAAVEEPAAPFPDGAAA